MTGVLGQAHREALARPELFIAVDIAVMMSFSAHAFRFGPPPAEPGDQGFMSLADFLSLLTCIGCGCTQDRACPGGCSWISVDPPICSACEGV